MNQDNVLAVRRMQAFIQDNLDMQITLKMLGQAAGYSTWYSAVIFKKFTSKSPFEYIRQLRLSKAALKIRDENLKIIDVAMNSEYNSHEGFTRAFVKQFNMTPKAYAETLPPIQLFVPYPVQIEKGEKTMEKDLSFVFVKVEDRPERKMIIRRGVKAKEYFAYCEEVGCDVWGILTSIKEAVSESVGMWLPKHLIRQGTSEYCQGVEVPQNYNKPLPPGFEILSLPKCKMLIFQGPKFQDDDYAEAIGSLWAAIKKYNPQTIGYAWANEEAPREQLEPRGERGYIEARPVRKL